jgi:hypothetical protein
LYSRKEDCSSLVDAEKLIVRHPEEKASAATEEEDNSQATNRGTAGNLSTSGQIGGSHQCVDQQVTFGLMVLLLLS